MATACRSKGGEIMTVKEKLTKLLEDATKIMDCPQMFEVADYLIKNNVTILPEGAIILTREEIAALNAYQEKLNGGGDALEKE